MVLPIASSIPYAVTDSLGNLICPRDPRRQLLGYRQVLSSQTTTSATQAQVTGVSVPVIVPTGRKIRITAYVGKPANATSAAQGGSVFGIWDGTVASGTELNNATSSYSAAAAGNQGVPHIVEAITTPTSASKTYNLGFAIFSSGNTNTNAASNRPVYLKVELY